MSKRGLTPRQARFVDEYLMAPSAREAAIRAGYSARSARSHAWTLLQNTAVADALDLAREKIANAAEVAAGDVIRELAAVAFAPVIEGGSLRYSDKLRALNLLGRHLKMFDASEGVADLDVAQRVEIVVATVANPEDAPVDDHGDDPGDGPIS